jgi:hypothetical protein
MTSQLVPCISPFEAWGLFDFNVFDKIGYLAVIKSDDRLIIWLLKVTDTLPAVYRKLNAPNVKSHINGRATVKLTSPSEFNAACQLNGFKTSLL